MCVFMCARACVDIQISKNSKAVTISAFPHLRPKSRQESNRLWRLRLAGSGLPSGENDHAEEDKCALSRKKHKEQKVPQT